jgi:hypothetical protein
VLDSLFFLNMTSGRPGKMSPTPTVPVSYTTGTVPGTGMYGMSPCFFGFKENKTK